MIKERIAIVFLILILTGGLFSCRKGDSDWKEDSERVTGGTCDYSSEPVTITVKEIEKETRRENKTSSDDSEMLIINYEMTFDDGIPARKGGVLEVKVKSIEAKAKGVEVGKKFHASVSRLVKGTCNPGPYYPGFEDWK